MLRKVELTALVIVDCVCLILALLLYYMGRFRWGWVGAGTEPPWPLVALFVMTVLWMLLFLFSGLYRSQFAPSRFDELILLFKVVTAGCLFLFFITFGGFIEAGSARPNLLLLWGSILGFVATGRMIVRSLQIALLQRGYGMRKALIVGWNDSVHDVYQEVAQYPAAGLKIVGAIQMRREEDEPALSLQTPATMGAYQEDVAVAEGVPLSSLPDEKLRTIQSLPYVIDSLGVQDVLLVLGPDDHHDLMEVLRVCDGKAVELKLLPDYYHILSGMARTEQIYGLPLIEVMPEPMAHWELNTKRGIDLIVSVLVLILCSPIWITLAILVRATSSGPAIFRQERVGQNGKPFTMYKYRTMRQNAEAETGPVWASEDDPRYTRLGRWLRKTRLDEIPQLVNVLKSEMSLVGPRPERRFFVDKLVKEIPLYTRRLRVKPGITGLAQVKWKYDESVEDVKQKVKYDLFYISNMSIGLDLKILFATLRTAFLGKGQ